MPDEPKNTTDIMKEATVVSFKDRTILKKGTPEEDINKPMKEIDRTNLEQAISNLMEFVDPSYQTGAEHLIRYLTASDTEGVLGIVFNDQGDSFVVNDGSMDILKLIGVLNCVTQDYTISMSTFYQEDL